MSDFIGIEVAGIEELRREFGNWPGVIQDEVIDSANAYILKNIEKYPPYKYVPFKTAYGGWFSEKQRRYVMARIAEGTIKPGMPNRSNRLAQGWKVIDRGTQSIIVNEVPYAGYVMGDRTQARMHQKIGWDTLGDWVNNHMGGIVKAAREGLTNALRKLRA